MNPPSKILLVIIDGASDRPNEDGTTPLKKANTPNLDKLASLGINGIMDTIAPGIRPGSDTAHLSLLGYDPHKYYTGRGPFEAAGVGIEVKAGDVAFRANFATMDENGIVTDRRAGRIRETHEIAKSIQESVKLGGAELLFRESTGHRAAVVFRGDGLSANISSTDPNKEGKPVAVSAALDEGKEARKTAVLVNEFTVQVQEILREHPTNVKRISEGKHPANTLLLRGAGLVPHIPDVEEKYGVKGAVVAAAGLVIGIGRMCGMVHLPVEGATGGMDSNIAGKVERAGKALDDYDFVMLNIKGADEAGHDRNFENKTELLCKADAELAPLLDIDPENVVIVVTADHSTPISVGNHSADPVPIMMINRSVRTDRVREYNEFAAAEGGLCRIRGMDLMNIVMDLTDRAHKYGA